MALSSQRSQAVVFVSKIRMSGLWSGLFLWGGTRQEGLGFNRLIRSFVEAFLYLLLSRHVGMRPKNRATNLFNPTLSTHVLEVNELSTFSAFRLHAGLKY